MNDILIIGAGPAGLTAAIYALRAGLSVTVLDKYMYGGQMAISDKIENYPGFDEITGYDLSMKLYNQAVNLGADIVFDQIDKIDFSNKIKDVFSSQSKYSSKAIIISSGTKRRKLLCKGEEEFTGKGVSYCATCDGAFFKGETAVVVGGGNTAVEDAIYLSSICQKVYLVHRRDKFKADTILSNTALNKNNIEVLYNTVIEEISGENNVNKVLIKNLIDNNKTREISTSAVFIAIGSKPDLDFLNETVKVDKDGYIEATENCTSSVPGVFVAGDCRTKPLRQIVTATSDGAVAAFQAINYINNNTFN